MKLIYKIKNNIYRRSLELGILCLSLACTCCSEEETLSTLTLEQQEVTLDAVSLNASFTVSSDEAWGIYKTPGYEWLSVAPATGSAGTTTITVSGGINRTADRTGSITLRTASGESREIKIIQGVIRKENSGNGNISEIRNMQPGSITQNIRISGIVTSEKSNSDGKTLFLQSSTSTKSEATANAIALKFNEEHNISLGEEIEVWVLDGVLEIVDKGLYQISNLPIANIISQQQPDNLPSARQTTIAELLEGGWDGQLVSVEGVEFMNIDATYGGEQRVWDSSKHELRVITEITAPFSGEKVAQGNGRLTGNIAYSGGTPVLRMRTLEDAAEMNGELLFGSFLIIADEEKEHLFPQGSRSQTIHVTANSSLKWQISIQDGEGWCSADKVSGTGSGEFTLNITGNKGSERKAVITVSANKVAPQTITVTQREINLMPNGGLEEWTNNLLPDNWDYNQGKNPVTSEYAKAGNAHSGSTCIQFTNFINTGTSQTTGGYFVQEIPVEGGKTYRISYWGKITGPNVRYRIYSRWRKQQGGGNLDNIHAAELRSAPYVDTTNEEWQQYSVTLTAPEEATYFNFDVRPYCKNSGGATSSVFLDSFEVVEVAE